MLNMLNMIRVYIHLFILSYRDQVAGNKRHEAAMKELAKRRQDQAAKVRASKGQVRCV